MGEGASKTGYLCKYRGHATASLWAPTWELRCGGAGGRGSCGGRPPAAAPRPCCFHHAAGAPHSTAPSRSPPVWSRCSYVILKGATLTYFRSERDVQFPPRGRIDLAGGAVVELEGLKRRRHWTWHVLLRGAGAQGGGCLC